MPHHCQGRIYHMSLLCYYQGKNGPYDTPASDVCGGGEGRRGCFSVERKKKLLRLGQSNGSFKPLHYGFMDVILVKDYKNIHYLQPWSALLEWK